MIITKLLYISNALRNLKSKMIKVGGWFTQNKGKVEILLFYVVTAALFREVMKVILGLELPLRNEFIIMWLIIVYLFKLKGGASVFLFIVLIIVSVLFLSFGATNLADQSANVAYLLVVVGTAQYFLQLLKD